MSKLTEQLALMREGMMHAGLIPAMKDSAICPLCWIEKPFGEFTDEHIVPKSVGGKVTIPTCEPCNNNDGSRLDSHLKEFYSLHDQVGGAETMPTFLRVNGFKVRADVDMAPPGGGKKIVILEDQSNPAHIKGIFDDGKANRIESISLDYSARANRRGLQGAYLRIAYLAAFDRFHYAFAMRPSIQRMREHIKNPKVDFERFAPSSVGMRLSIPNLPVSHFIVQGRLADVPALMVVIRLQRNATHFRGVFVPFQDDRADEMYQLLAIAAAAGGAPPAFTNEVIIE